MESRLHSVPISATKMAPKAAPISGIRAPVTVDESDFQYSVSSKSRRNSTSGSYYSGSELEFDDSLSGEDGFETSSEGPYVNGPDEEIHEETHFVKEFAFSRPCLVRPSGEKAQESCDGVGNRFSKGIRSGNVGGNAVIRPFVRSLDVDDSDDSRSLLSESGDEYVEDEDYVSRKDDYRPIVVVRDEEVSENGATPVVDVRIPVVPKLRIPIALVSGDSDDDSRSDGILEDEGFLGIVRVPSVEVLSRVNSALKVRITEADEGEDNDSPDEYTVEVNFVEDLVISNGVVNRKDEMEHIGLEDSIRCGTGSLNDENGKSSDTCLEDNLVFYPDIESDKLENRTEEGMIADSFKSTNADKIRSVYQYVDLKEMPTEGSPRLTELLELDHDSGLEIGISNACESVFKNAKSDHDSREETENIEEVGCKIEDSTFNTVTKAMVDEMKSEHECSTSLSNEESLLDHRQQIDVIGDQRMSVDVVDDMSCVASAAEMGCRFVVDNSTDHEVAESGSIRNFGTGSLNDESGKSSDTCLEDSLIFYSDIGSDKLENGTEEGMIVDLFNSIGADKIRSVYQYVDIKEMPTEGSPQLPELPELDHDNRSETGISNACESVFKDAKSDHDSREETENIEEVRCKIEDSTFNTVTKAMVAEMESECEYSTSVSKEESLRDHTQQVDSRNVTQSDEGVDVDGGIGHHRRIIDSVIGGASDGNIENFSLGSVSADVDSTEARHPDLSVPSPTNGELEEALSEREKKQLTKLQQIRVKYLRLLHRLGCSPKDSVASKILYQLRIAEARFSFQAFDLDSAKYADMELEAQKKDDLDFSLCILVIGKTGVGKSATINSLFGERKTVINAFEPATTRVKEIIGTIDGLKLKVFDTPGLRTSLIDQSVNRKTLFSIKKQMKKTPPDVILYVDRLDTQTSNLNDLPLLKLITSYLGSSIWRKSFVSLTHATSIPPDGPDGYPLSYESFIAQRSWVVQQLIGLSCGELLAMNHGSMIPVSVVENNPFTTKNGESWKRQLLLFCYSMKTLSETSSVVSNQNPLDDTKLFGRSTALSHFLSSLLQPSIHSERSGESVVSVVELGLWSDSNQEDDTEYNNLPPLEPVKKSQIAKLIRDHDYGYNGILIEDKLNLTTHFPALISVQLVKDKKQFNIQLHPSASTKHHDNGSSTDLDIQTLAYVLKGETKIKNFRNNKTAAGLFVTFLGENTVSGLKVEDTAYGANIDFCCTRDEDYYPISQNHISMGLSMIKHRNDLTFGCKLKSQFCVGRNSKVNITAGLNNRLNGQICIKTNCSDQLQIAALVLLPIVRAIFKKIFRQSAEDFL